jgi:predicted lipoprotein with Yx(FWY)xxD motif
MRKFVLAAAIFAAASLAGGAFAQAMPDGVHMSGGGMVDGQGRALYTFKWDTMKGMSHCEGHCAQAWPPFVAAPDAKPSGDWTIIARDDGSHQWAFKDKPLYLYAKDTAGQPATGVSQNWDLAH